MKYKEIKLEGNKSILVDESAEIKEGDTFIVLHHNGISKCSKGTEHVFTDRKKFNKITATINHSIDLDVPMVIVEDEVEKFLPDLDKVFIQESEEVYRQTGSLTSIEILKKGISIGLGFKASQQKGVYPESDIEKAIEFGLQYSFDQKMVERYKKDKLKFIQSLTQETIDLEMEFECHDLESESWERIKTDRVNGQLIAYAK
jgi:hypothetical protein